jgi:hypothetical protein
VHPSVHGSVLSPLGRARWVWVRSCCIHTSPAYLPKSHTLALHTWTDERQSRPSHGRDTRPLLYTTRLTLPIDTVVRRRRIGITSFPQTRRQPHPPLSDVGWLALVGRLQDSTPPPPLTAVAQKVAPYAAAAVGVGAGGLLLTVAAKKGLAQVHSLTLTLTLTLTQKVAPYAAAAVGVGAGGLLLTVAAKKGLAQVHSLTLTLTLTLPRRWRRTRQRRWAWAPVGCCSQWRPRRGWRRYTARERERGRDSV